MQFFYYLCNSLFNKLIKMMKKYFLKLFTIMVVTTMGCGFVSCGDDDDDNGTSASDASDKDSTKRVKSVGDCVFSYKDNGLVDYITIGDLRCDFSYNPNKMVQSYNGKEEAVASFSQNSLGFITQVEVNSKNEEEAMTGSTTIGYDGSGHLVSMKGLFTRNNKGSSEQFTETLTLTWQDDKLMSAVWETEGTDMGYPYHYLETYEYEYAKNLNDYYNKYRQYAPSLIGAYGDGIDEVLAIIKKLGNGPLYLPVSCTHTDNESGYKRSETEQYSYGFNDDGSISYCSVNDRRYVYSY